MVDWTAPRVGDLRVDVLSPQGVKLGTIDGVLGGSLDAATARQIRTVGQLDVIGDRDDWLTIRLRPVFVMTSPVAGEFPLGVYLPSTPRATHDGTGQARLSVDLYDRLRVLTQDTTIKTYVVRAGTAIIPLVRTLLTTYGEGPHAIPDSTATVRTPMTWDGGTEWLTVVNDLLQAAGYTGLRYDEAGTARSGPYVPPEKRPVRWTFTEGADAIRLPEITVNADYFAVCNRVVAVAASSGDEPEMTAVAQNLNDGPLSYAALGRWVTRREDGVDVADQAALQAYADRLLAEATQLTVGVEVTHGWLPDVGLGERVRVVDGPAGLDLYAQVTRQTIPLDPTMLVTSEVGTVVRPGDWIDAIKPVEDMPITWGEVTAVDPIRVRRDGDDAPMDADLGVLTDVVLGDRVACYRNGRQLIIVGRVGARPTVVYDTPTWINTGQSSVSRVIAYIDVPAAPYPRVLSLSANLIAKSQTIDSGTALAECAASFNASRVEDSDAFVPISQQSTNVPSSVSFALDGYLLPAGIPVTCRIWHYNSVNAAITWGYTDTRRRFTVTARPL